MKYNILFGLESGSYNLMEIDKTKLPLILKAYEFGNTKFTISGKTHSMNKLRDFKIFEHNEKVDINEFEKYCSDNNIA